MMSQIIRILLVDHHPLVRIGLRVIIEACNDLLIVADAGNAETAREMVTQHHPDVVVLNVHLPEESGLQLAMWIRANHPGMGILMITEYTDTEYVCAMLGAGANHIILKNDIIGIFAEAIRTTYAISSNLLPKNPTNTG